MTVDGFLVAKGGRAIALITLLSAMTLVFTLAYASRAHALDADATATSVAVTASPAIIPADGITMSTITAVVTDVNGNNVPDGTTVGFTTTLGILSSPTAPTVGGKASVTLVSDSADTPGVAAVIAQSGSASGSAGVTIAAAGTATKLSIALPSSCDVGGTCAIAVAATDAFGHPVPDGLMASLNASDGTVVMSPVATSGGTATFSYTAPATAETVTLTAAAGNGLAPAATATLTIGALAAPASLPAPTQDVVVATPTGTFCFNYAGPAESVSSFATFFNSGVMSVNIMQLPAGNFLSWFQSAPALATATSLSNGQIVCVSAATGSNVFAQS